LKLQNVEINDLKDKCEKLELEKEKIINLFDSYKQATQSVGELMQRAEENATLKADLEHSRKIISNLQAKLKAQQSKHEEQLNDIKEKIRLEQDASHSIRVELDNKENKIEEYENCYKEVSNYYYFNKKLHLLKLSSINKN
jgi:hypothetical protein